MIKAVIFDCFGVIISDALQVVCDELAATDRAGADAVRDLVRASNKGLIDPQDSNRQIADILGISPEDYQQRIRDGEAKDERVMKYITQLHGPYKTALLSNISATGLARRFTADELAACFDVVVSSGEIGYAKPEARAYEIVAERLEVRLDECVFTDDRSDFCEGARAVGMQAIDFTSFEQFKKELTELLPRPV